MTKFLAELSSLLSRNRSFVLTSEKEAEPCNITTIISKASGEITSMNYPDPYPTNCQWTYVVHVGNGHYIQVKVTHFDVDVEKGDLLTIEPSNSNV